MSSQAKAIQAFGVEVMRRRLALKMSREDLGAVADLSAQYIRSIEEASRPRGVSLVAALRIAKGLGAELPDLLGFQGFEGVGVEAARLVQALPPHLMDAAMVVLRALREEATR